MGTKTIGLDDEAYERLRAHKREDESFSDTVKRLTGIVAEEWERSFGKYSDRGDEFEAAARGSRDTAAEGLTTRQSAATEILAEQDDQEDSS